MKRLLMAIVVLSFVSTSFAQTKKTPQRTAPKTAPAKKSSTVKEALSNTNKGAYGMGGCGLGSLVFADSESRAGQVLAVTTNGIYSNNTFGVSSGTSNCVPDGARTADIKKNMGLFIVANREALVNDVVRSKGETIVAMSALMGCKDSTYLGAKLQSRYEIIFSSEEEGVVASNMYDTVSSDRYLLENCKL